VIAALADHPIRPKVRGVSRLGSPERTENPISVSKMGKTAQRHRIFDAWDVRGDLFANPMDFYGTVKKKAAVKPFPSVRGFRRDDPILAHGDFAGRRIQLARS